MSESIGIIAGSGQFPRLVAEDAKAAGYGVVVCAFHGFTDPGLEALAWRLLEQGPFKGIIGVARGGLVPAAIVARELNIRLVDTLCICTYQGREQTGGEEVLKAVEGDGDGWLVVDDLVDTGNTATIIRNMLPKAHFATLYSKPAGKPLVNTFITEVSQDTWILFPWDSEVQYTAPLVEQN